MNSEKKLVLFDVDHTLMDAGEAHRLGFKKAFEEVLGVEFDLSKWNFNGYTDLQIIYEVFDNNKLEKNPQKVREVIDCMIDDFTKRDLSDAYLLEGVPDILKELSSDENVAVGLVTGNIEEIAYCKLNHLGINEFFLVGGFGGTSHIRSELVHDAIKKAEEHIGEIDKNNVFVIGDTTRDIKAAKDAGVKVIATATGNHSFELLEEKNPDLLVKNLGNTEKIVEMIRHG